MPEKERGRRLRSVFFLFTLCEVGILVNGGSYRPPPHSSSGRRSEEYFYGLTNELSPHANVVNFSDLLIYRFGGPQAPRSALPIGAEPSADPTRVAPVTITSDLVHAVLAVSYAKEPELLLSRKKISYIAPSPGEIPSRLLLAGSLTWVD